MRSLAQYAQIFDSGTSLALVVLVLLAVLIFPVPTIMLDLGISLSLTIAVILFVTSLTIRGALDLDTLPSLLLLSTIFRLLLNVATSRQILSNTGAGEYAAGRVIATFGHLLMNGDIIVGLIVFGVLITVNLSVISKGLGRIAEVSARFHLDSLPGKQMAIDADLSSGQIDETVARQRRAELEKQGGFYSAMDGASKFVKGDAVAAMVMAAINIVGGIAVGMLQGGLTFQDAIATYTTLMVGDGLVSQIPAILVSLAAGIVVSKGATGERLQDDLFRQMATSSPALTVASAAATVIAFVTNMPIIPLLTMFVCTGALAWGRLRPARNPAPQVTEPAAVRPSLEAAPPVDPVRIELGFGLLELAAGTTRPLTEQIRKLRENLALELGFLLPSVRIQDNMNLAPNQYAFMIKEVRAGVGDLEPALLLAISPGDDAAPISGQPTTEPTFGLPARWITPEAADMARAATWTVVDPATVMITHLAEVMKENMAELLTYSETQRLINESPQQQKLVNDLIPGMITLGHLQRVLQALLAERVSIRDLSTILEAVHEACSGTNHSIAQIVTNVRIRLSRQICESLTAADGHLPIITISPAWEDTLSDALTGPAEDRQLALGAEKLRDLINGIRSATESAIRAGIQPILVSGQHVRAHLHGIVDRARINIPVLAHAEIHRRAKVKMVGTV
ncbi:MAG TPA: flagellar biosynthesis protein FlhA [Rhodopila sp.]|nr:flagellar biosynthesis protein FlhA [Rhodopila sp.]